MNQYDNFKFYIDADIIKGDSEGEMRIRGIASDSSKDRQGEYLDPRTMDLSDFDIINWNHKGKDDPSAIIGYPDKSKVKITPNNELYVEGVLHNNVPMAKATYNLMNALQKSPNGKRLGMSVEGMVLERDPNNPNKITKSKITGVAICPVPVNGATWTELIQKGFTDEHDPIYDNETLLLEQELEKAISIESTTDSKENTGIDRKIEKESIDGATPKKKKKSVKEVIDNDLEEDVEEKGLSKAETYEKIFNYFYINDLQKAKSIFNIITKISEMDKKEITDETIQKAMSILDLASEASNEETVVVDEVVKSEDSEDLEKAMKNKEVIKKNDDEVVEENKNEEDVDKDSDNEEVIEKKSKPKFSDKVAKAAKEDCNDMVKKGLEFDEIQKSMSELGYSSELVSDVYDSLIVKEQPSNSIDKSVIEDLMKSQVEELSTLIKSQNDELDSKFSKYDSVIKSYSDQIETLSKSFTSITEENTNLKQRLENIEKTPLSGKSILSKSFVDRFEASNTNSAYNLNSKSDRNALIQKSFDLGVAKGDEELMRVAAVLESTGQLTPRHISKLTSVGISVI